MNYNEAKEIYEKLNGIATIPSDVMRVIVEYKNEHSKTESAGISLEKLRNIPKKHLDRIINNGYQFYEYLDNNDFINYEGFKKGEIVMAKFNGVNYVTADILKYCRIRKPDKHGCKANINSMPPIYFFQRYKLVEIK